MKRILIILAASLLCLQASAAIDRAAVVHRHDIITRSTMQFSPAQVGNGRFAFGVDITGLQTFAQFNTLSDWGWHSFPLPEGKKVEDYSPVVIKSYGRKIPYMDEDPNEPELTAWLKCNPHRVNLGRLGFMLRHEDGSLATEAQLSDRLQKVDLWTGLVSSRFVLDGVPVHVRTSCAPDRDMISVVVESDLLLSGRLQLFMDFPYADGKSFSKEVGLWHQCSAHSTEIVGTEPRTCTIRHSLDDLSYETTLRADLPLEVTRQSDTAHRYIFTPAAADRLMLTCEFHQGPASAPVSCAQIESASADEWLRYWSEGAAIDLSGSKDPRWRELERRIVISQYLMRLNEYGGLPPQESGLVNNGWYGRFHWEMIWWHWAHYFLWGRMEVSDMASDAYNQFMQGALERAASEGRRGAKWPKCTGNFNREWPCDTHAMLMWQQPHPIYFAEMDYRHSPSGEVLDRWAQIVLESADYLADLPFWDRRTKRYVLGPPVRNLSENTPPRSTINPIFELVYLRYGLQTALKWADRLRLPESRTRHWRKVLRHLSELPQEDGYYITNENMEDMWGSFNFEHPAITGLYGWLPGEGVDKEVFSRTFYRVLKDWQMDKIWGWDYPMMAMAAARLGDPATAVDLLTTTSHKFGFDAHGLATTWPFPYFPANGGLLTAVAMMAAGWDGAPDAQAPGFPQDGSWTVVCEGFDIMQ